MPLAGVLLVAVTANLAFASWPHDYPLYMLFVAVALALAGPGGYALVGSSVGGSGSFGVALGMAGAVAMEGRRQAPRLAPSSRPRTEKVPEEPGEAG